MAGPCLAPGTRAPVVRGKPTWTAHGRRLLHSMPIPHPLLLTCQGQCESVDLRYTVLRQGNRRLFMPNSCFLHREFLVTDAQPAGKEGGSRRVPQGHPGRRAVLMTPAPALLQGWRGARGNDRRHAGEHLDRGAHVDLGAGSSSAAPAPAGPLPRTVRPGLCPRVRGRGRAGRWPSSCGEQPLELHPSTGPSGAPRRPRPGGGPQGVAGGGRPASHQLGSRTVPAPAAATAPGSCLHLAKGQRQPILPVVRPPSSGCFSRSHRWIGVFLE